MNQKRSLQYSSVLGLIYWIVTLAIIITALLLSGWLWLRFPTLQWGPFQFDRLSTFFVLLILGSSLLACLQMYPVSRKGDGASNCWLLCSCLGAVVVVTANHLLILVLGFELVTIPLLLWAGWRETNERADEVRLKYFVTAGVSTAFLVWGVVLFHALSGSFQFADVQEKLLFMTDTVMVRLALICLLVGLAYQLAWVPFQFVVPDLYEGSTTAVLGYMAIVSKLSALAVLLRLMNVWWHIEALPWTALFTVLSVLCLLVGSIASLVQTNLKRRLASTSIAQVGFFLAAMTALSHSPLLQEKALAAVLFYSLAYALMISGSFALVWALRTADNVPIEDSDYAGLAARAPWGAACLTLFFCALSGLPPTIGFIGKFDLLRVVVEADKIGLALMMLLAWIVSAAAYMQVVFSMYFKSSQHEKTASVSYPVLLVVASCAILTLYWGLLPSTLLQVSAESARALIY